MEIWPEVNYDKPKYRVTSRDHNAGRSYNVLFDISSFEWAEQFKIWEQP